MYGIRRASKKWALLGDWQEKNIAFGQIQVVIINGVVVLCICSCSCRAVFCRTVSSCAIIIKTSSSGIF